jgi:hypothetical protein
VENLSNPTKKDMYYSHMFENLNILSELFTNDIPPKLVVPRLILNSYNISTGKKTSTL